jgi:acyl-[acyl-carrier-protein]-phospholipid O-acyltransferase/long-chain-fatty-acid--[acyl-carrier-protein] ligase
MLLPQPHSRHPLQALLIAQFLGAFNDNAWKLIVALVGIRRVAAEVGGTGPALEAAVQTQMTMTFVVFTLPLMLVSLPAGMFADRQSKRSVIIGLKAVEMILMSAGAIALFTDPSGSVFPLIVLALMGAQSALFSPAKYGILPEILPRDRLAEGNGLLEMWTFLAIIAGTYAGGLFLDLAGDASWLGGLVLTGLAGIGFAASSFVPRVPPARAEGGIAATVRSAWAAIRGDRVLGLAVFGTIVFWAIASLVSQNILVYAKAVLGLSDATTGLPLAVLAVGIGLGSLGAGKLSRPEIEYGLIPLGALGMTVFTLLLGLVIPGLVGTLVIMIFLGAASGLLAVPLNVLIQWRSPADRRGAVIALSNTFVFGGVIAGSFTAEGFSRLGFSVSEIFVAAALIAGIGATFALWLLSDAFLGLVARARLIHRRTPLRRKP